MTTNTTERPTLVGTTLQSLMRLAAAIRAGEFPLPVAIYDDIDVVALYSRVRHIRPTPLLALKNVVSAQDMDNIAPAITLMEELTGDAACEGFAEQCRPPEINKVTRAMVLLVKYGPNRKRIADEIGVYPQRMVGPEWEQFNMRLAELKNKGEQPLRRRRAK